jgi:DNA-binding NarL/FixJ family response regulator
MKTLLLSDQAALQIGLERALDKLDHHVEVWRTPVLSQAIWFLARDRQVDLVVVDLPWCGLAHLPTVVSQLRAVQGHAKLVVLLDRPDDLRLVVHAGVEADLTLSKTLPTMTLRSTLGELVWGRKRPDWQTTTELAA